MKHNKTNWKIITKNGWNYFIFFRYDMVYNLTITLVRTVYRNACGNGCFAQEFCNNTWAKAGAVKRAKIAVFLIDTLGEAFGVSVYCRWPRTRPISFRPGFREVYYPPSPTLTIRPYPSKSGRLPAITAKNYFVRYFFLLFTHAVHGHCPCGYNARKRHC